MNDKNLNHLNCISFSLRVNEELLEKFKKLSKLEGRSMNKQFERLLIIFIQEYEKKNNIEL